MPIRALAGLRSRIWDFILLGCKKRLSGLPTCCRVPIMTWEDEARRILKAELVRKGFKYKHLASSLRGIGIELTERSIKNRMSRGTFSFVFFLQCMKAIGAKSVSFEL
jgi:hypothetical protein